MMFREEHALSSAHKETESVEKAFATRNSSLPARLAVAASSLSARRCALEDRCSNYRVPIWELILCSIHPPIQTEQASPPTIWFLLY